MKKKLMLLGTIFALSVFSVSAQAKHIDKNTQMINWVISHVDSFYSFDGNTEDETIVDAKKYMSEEAWKYYKTRFLQADVKDFLNEYHYKQIVLNDNQRSDVSIDYLDNDIKIKMPLDIAYEDNFGNIVFSKKLNLVADITNDKNSYIFDKIELHND
jgi:hypothetical protein